MVLQGLGLGPGLGSKGPRDPKVLKGLGPTCGPLRAALKGSSLDFRFQFEAFPDDR